MRTFEIRYLDSNGKLLRRAIAQATKRGQAVATARLNMGNAARYEIEEV